MKEAWARSLHNLECSNCCEQINSCDRCKLDFLDEEEIFCSETGKHYCEDCIEEVLEGENES